MNSGLTPEILGLIQDGHLPLEIAKKVLNCEKNFQEPSESYESEKETFPDELVIISQALAYRNAEVTDSKAIYEILNKSYHPETEGPEAFRFGDFMSLERIKDSVESESSLWLLVEVPEGRETNDDGSIIGLCNYTTDGVSRKNGEVEGKLGSVHGFAILPRFHGLCIGQRLLAKVENEMRKMRCVRMMFSVPSFRASMCAWMERRKFVLAGCMAYPDAIGHFLTKSSVKLNIFLRPIVKLDPKTCVYDADAKHPPEIVPTTIRLTSPDIEQTHVNNRTQTEISIVPPARNGIHLPPQWRPEMYTQDISATLPSVHHRDNDDEI